MNLKASLARTSHYILWASLIACSIIAAILASKYFHAMATTSIWVDEFHTVMDFAQKGLWTAWTDYSAPNNHILFSMLLSFVPAELAYDPFWARLPSFLVVGAALIGLVVFGKKEGALAAGVLAAALLIANDPTMRLTLQARGYGLLFFTAVFQSISLYYYLTTNSRRALISFYVFAVAGGATVPIYILLVATTCLATLAINFKWDFIIGGIIAGIVGLLFHVPTIFQIIEVMNSYGTDWGRYYASISAPIQTLGYFFPEGHWSLAALFLIAILGFADLGVHKVRPALKFLIVAAVSVIAFLIVCRIMETPLVRTTQYIAGVTAVALVVVAKPVGEQDAWIGVLRRLALSMGLLLTSVVTFSMAKNWNFIPRENYLGVAQFIEATLPSDTRVYAPFRSEQMRVHLRNPDRIVDEFDPAAFSSGALVYVDADLKSDQKFSGKTVTPDAYDFEIPQIRRAFQRVSFVPDRSGALQSIRMNDQVEKQGGAAFDGDETTYWTYKAFQSTLKDSFTFSIELDPDKGCPAFVWFAPHGDLPKRYDATLQLESGKRLALKPDRVITAAHHMIIDLSYLEVTSIEFEVHRGNRNRFVAIHEAWCTQ